jgi:hypothetical protein
VSVATADITLDTPVEFDYERQTLTGKVSGVMRDIGNGQGFAVVEIDHDLPGIVHQVALDQLRKRVAK